MIFSLEDIDVIQRRNELLEMRFEFPFNLLAFLFRLELKRSSIPMKTTEPYLVYF